MKNVPQESQAPQNGLENLTMTPDQKKRLDYGMEQHAVLGSELWTLPEVAISNT